MRRLICETVSSVVMRYLEAEVDGIDYRKIFIAMMSRCFMKAHRKISVRSGISSSTVIEVSFMLRLFFRSSWNLFLKEFHTSHLTTRMRTTVNPCHFSLAVALLELAFWRVLQGFLLSLESEWLCGDSLSLTIISTRFIESFEALSILNLLSCTGLSV